MKNYQSTTQPIKPDLGLYQTKYILRNLLRQIPRIQNLSPNVISVLAIIPGLLAAFCLFKSAWLGTLIFILLRMSMNTLDGLIAEEFNKKSNLGAYLNRLPGEITDIVIVLALWSYSHYPWNIALTILSGWVQVLGLLGLAAGGPTQSVGPCGQTDRLAIILLGCLLALIGYPVWSVLIQILCIGCVLTIILRIERSIKAINLLDESKA